MSKSQVCSTNSVSDKGNAVPFTKSFDSNKDHVSDLLEQCTINEDDVDNLFLSEEDLPHYLVKQAL